jgi:outer membrane protein insertion porin family
LQGYYTQYIPIKLITASHKTPPVATESQPETLALNIQGGTFVGDLPPYNAFVLGGPASVRGWDTGGIGSARTYIEASAEYRFPIYRFIGGAAFVDFASALDSQGSVPGEPGLERDKPGTGIGFGFGVRVNSPFGILRGDLGFSNRGDVRFQFGFGQRY